MTKADKIALIILIILSTVMFILSMYSISLNKKCNNSIGDIIEQLEGAEITYEED